MVRYEGEKMSKSLGNLIWARDLLQSHSADAVRILVNGHPYHETWEYNAAELAPADDLAARLLAGAQAVGGAGVALDPVVAVTAFEAALDDNLNTPAALVALGELADGIVAAPRPAVTWRRPRRPCASWAPCSAYAWVATSSRACGRAGRPTTSALRNIRQSMTPGIASHIGDHMSVSLIAHLMRHSH